MNKAERHQKKMVKFKKRLKQMGLTNVIGNFHSLRSHGKPCSCHLCKSPKYRNTKRKKEKQEIIKNLKNESIDG